jgi:hypothetical protein
VTLEEAQKVAEICSKADDGCSVCVKQLLDLLVVAFPGFHWVVDDHEEATISVSEKRDSA